MRGTSTQDYGLESVRNNPVAVPPKKLGLGDPTSPLLLPTDRDQQALALRPLTEILVPAHAQES